MGFKVGDIVRPSSEKPEAWNPDFYKYAREKAKLTITSIEPRRILMDIEPPWSYGGAVHKVSYTDREAYIEPVQSGPKKWLNKILTKARRAEIWHGSASGSTKEIRSKL